VKFARDASPPLLFSAFSILHHSLAWKIQVDPKPRVESAGNLGSGKVGSSLIRCVLYLWISRPEFEAKK
jgi:hypothetical protein